MKKIKLLLIGPFPNPTTGVALANQVLFENLLLSNEFYVTPINTAYNKFDENLGSFSLRKLFFYIKINFYVFRIFKSDIIYLTPGQTFFGVVKYSLFFIFSKLLKKQLVVHIHGNHLKKEYTSLKGLKKKIFKTLLGFSSKGIVLSESLKDNMTPFIDQSKVHVLYNFVEDFIFVRRKDLDKKLSIEKPRIIFLSNLMEEKGIFDLLEALKILEEQGFSYKAKIAGNIDSKNNKKLNGYFGNLMNTEYIGVVSGKKKKELLLWANIFVLPTYYEMEGQPISILENLASGNIILTTKHAGIPDIFKEDINGYFVDKQNAKSIKEAILKCIVNNEKSLLMMKNNYEVARGSYRVKKFIDNIIDIFEA